MVREMELWGGLLDNLKKEMKNGTANDCVIAEYLKNRAEAGHEEAPGRGLSDNWLNDTMLAYAGGTILEAGSDTVAATLLFFILFMLNNPEVLRKAREEVDRVVGPDRLPTFDDEENLPYLIACIKETMRRRPVAIMGMQAIFYMSRRIYLYPFQASLTLRMRTTLITDTLSQRALPSSVIFGLFIWILSGTPTP
jgi:hypothetical protein